MRAGDAVRLGSSAARVEFGWCWCRNPPLILAIGWFLDSGRSGALTREFELQRRVSDAAEFQEGTTLSARRRCARSSCGPALLRGRQALQRYRVSDAAAARPPALNYAAGASVQSRNLVPP